jgi:hypothetical protein
MGMQKVEFEFPDPDKGSASETDFELEIEGRASEKEDAEPTEKPENEAKKPQKRESAEDVEIEVVDDTPPKDRNKKPSDPPEDVTDDELENYSEKVRKRIKHFSKGYHDERRAREAALREKEEAVRLAKQLMEENSKLKGSVNKSQEALIEQAKRAVATEIVQAKAKYKEAYESGDADAVVEAQEALTTAKLRADKVNNFRPPPLQPERNEVQQAQPASETAPDPRAVDWQKENPWFGSDDEMTSFALGLHQKLVKQGVDPRGDDYYEKINSRMRTVFKEYFDEDGMENEESDLVAEKPRQKANVVAPATRSTAPKKIVLTQSQVALAKRLGVPLEEYAKQVAEATRKQNV